MKDTQVLARLVGHDRREGENEVQAAIRILKAQKARPARKQKPHLPPELQTKIDAPFEEVDSVTGVEFELELEKGDPKHRLDAVGAITFEYSHNGTIAIVWLTAARSDHTGIGVSKRSPHDRPNEMTGIRTAAVRAVRDMVAKVTKRRKR